MAAIMAAAAICGAFAGCGGDKKANGSASGEQTVKFGFLGAYTGPAAAYGQAMKEGTELAVEEINKDPNTKMKIDLKTYDTKGTPRPPELQTWVIISSEMPSPAKWLSPLP